MGLNISENDETSEKRCVEIEDWGFSVHFALGFQKNSFTLYIFYVLVAKILQNGAKFSYRKAAFKNYRNLNNFRQALESPKSWNLMGFCPKNTFLQLKHYIQWIYLTLSNISTTCVKIHQITYVLFETISHFSQHNSSVSF